MSHFQGILMWFSAVAAGVMSVVGFAVWCDQRQVFPGRRLLGAFRRLPWPVQFFLLAFSLHLIVHGSIKTNAVGDVEGAAQQRGRDIPVACNKAADTFFSCDRNVASPLYGAGQTVTSEEIARGWRLVGVNANSTVDYAMPEGAVLVSNWWVRGAFDDEVKIGNREWGTGNGDWRFPFGDSEYDSLWALSWGRLRFALGDATTEIVAVGSPMSAIPFVSRLWTAATTGDSRLVTWENFALGRIPLTSQTSQASQAFLSAQIELKKSGDFIARSNEVENVYRRVCPEDWDDDGIPNVRDPRPCTCDGDFFGPRQTLPDGANANAYCWIELVADVNAHVVFAGDGESDLPDPDFMLRAGETNRVTLLIGKTYSVESDGPLTVTDRSDEGIRVYGGGSCSLTAVWPVSVSVAEDNGTGFRMRVDPDRIGGEFDWDTCCCPIIGWGRDFSWECGGLCLCSGCTAYGTLVYEGYSIPVEGGSCGCSCGPRPIRTEPDDGQMVAGVSASFSPEAVIFEDAYTNMPGWVENGRSTEAVLSCTVHGGFRGGTATFAFAGETNLVWVRGASVPHQPVTIPPGEKLSFAAVYKGLRPSAEENDVVYTVTFTENDTTNAPTEVEAKLTSVKLQLTAVYDAPENDNRTRHLYGVGESVELRHLPLDANVVWSIDANDVFSELKDADAYDKLLKLHFVECVTEVDACFAGARYRPTISLVEPQGVLCRECAWDGTCIAKDLAGGVGMNLKLYIIPMYVSFQGIDVAEIPCDTVIPPTGYYATTNFNGVLSHSLDAEAGDWHHVKAGNYWCMDNAWSNIRRPEWTDGTMIWNIPIQWYQRLEATESWMHGTIHADGRLIGGSKSAYQQRFDISSAGTVRVSKHYHWVERTTNDVIRLDGEIVHSGMH